MKTYKVNAHVSVIAEAYITVKARNQIEAQTKALKLFKQKPEIRHSCVVPNSSDERHPIDFTPMDVEELKETPAP